MLSFSVSHGDATLIAAIVERATTTTVSNTSGDRMRLYMDLIACHANGCPLQLAEMLEGNALDFLHDVAGISEHIDRRTGKLTDHFWPRYAVQQ